MWTSVLAISFGAAIGALIRWGLGVWLNGMFPHLPPGTAVANVAGGYMIGVAVVLFTHHATLPAEWRLFVITGFLGGLTTFSTFSAEVVNALQAGRHLWAGAIVTLHLAGSLAATFAGIATATWWVRR